MTTVLRQPLKAVLGMLALLLAACGESHEQMVLQLEELERQNRDEVLENNLDVIASEIHIGSNVATEREPGPISVENGYSILSDVNGTTIHNDFEVKLGAELEIYTNN